MTTNRPAEADDRCGETSDRRRFHRVVVTPHAAWRFAERVLAPDDPRARDLPWLKRHIAWLVHHSDTGGHLRRDPLVGPWLAKVGRENRGRPIVPCFHWDQLVGFILADDRSDPQFAQRVVLTCFHCGDVTAGQRRVDPVSRLA